MAFYAVRLDEENREIETSRRTFRGVDVNKSEISAPQTAPIENNTNKEGNTYKAVRYVNSAAFIVNDMKTKKASTEVKEKDNDSNQNTSRSSSDCCEIADSQYQSHISTTCIPLLELNSTESFPSSNEMSYSYRKICEVTKMIQKPDAYKEWLVAKRTSKFFQLKRKEEKEREEEEKRQQRRVLAEQKYREWVARKNKEKLEKELKIENNINAGNNNSDENNQLAKEKNFNAWLEAKLKQQKMLKEKINQELKLEMGLEQIRRQKSEEIYREWVQNAVNKPKPVPLNRGLLTLKGSVSRLYINPVSWVSVDTTEGSNNF